MANDSFLVVPKEKQKDFRNHSAERDSDRSQFRSVPGTVDLMIVFGCSEDIKSHFRHLSYCSRVVARLRFDGSMRSLRLTQEVLG
jgi:hypothetical protein